MEKLQIALEKARNSRKQAEPAARPRRMKNTPPGDNRTERLWQELIEIEPANKTLRSHNVVTREANEKATPFDILRTKVLLQMQQNGWTSIAITSPMPRCGKTTMACNLAIGLGRQSNLRTILFDMDLKSPSVGEFLGYTPQDDISDMLSGAVPFSEQAVRVGENVAVSVSKHSVKDSTRILLADQTQEKLESIRTSYSPDIMIFDMPSILVGDDTRAFLKNVDCALIVTRANTTRFGHFDTCEREVAEYTSVIGTVLNALPSKDR